MNCQSCKAAIPDGGKFCPECGATAKSSSSCTYCGEQNPPNSSFCAGCGQSLKSKQHSQNGGVQTQEVSSDFVYLLSEEKMRTISSSGVRIPYGCFAVTLVNGAINGVHDRISSSKDNSSVISEFLKSVSEFARALVGQKNNDVKTYIVNDLQGLPLISYVHPIKLPAIHNASLKFDFWLEFTDLQVSSVDGSLGLFFQRTMGGKTKISTAEFRQVAIAGVQSILGSQSSLDVESQVSLDHVIELLRKTTGISGRCTLVKGKSVERRYIEVSKVQRKCHCVKCNEAYSSKVKFCEVCGSNMESADWASTTEVLQSASGEVILLKISFLSDKEAGGIGDTEIAEKVISILGTIIRKLETPQINDSNTLAKLTIELNKALGLSFNSLLSDFSVIDIKTAGQEWFFKTEALIAEELRNIDTQQRGLAVQERALDFNEAAFSVAMRNASQRDAHRRQELQLRTQTVEIELDEYALELGTNLRRDEAELDIDGKRHSLLTNTDLNKEKIDHTAEAVRLEREKEKFKRDREFQREVNSENRLDQVEQTNFARSDEIDQAQHEIKLEKTVAQHDIELSDLTGEAQSRAKRRDIADNSFESEEEIRLKATEKVQIGNIEEDLLDRQNKRQVDKLKALAEIEANMTKQEHEFQLSKVDGMKHLDAAQILALQAAELAKAGGKEAAAEIVKSIAQSQADAAGAGLKDDLYKQMLQTKEDAAKLALDAQKSAMDALLKSNEGIAKLAGSATSSAVEGYKEAAKVAQTTNEKSMDSMSKVATAAAGRKPTKEEAEASTMTDCNSQECDFVFEGKVKKFCPKCGTNQF